MVSICRITCNVVISLFFRIYAIPTILLFAQNPIDPTFTLEHASVHGFNLTSDGHLTSFFNVVIKANNPNHKMRLHYSSIRVSIFRDLQKMAEDALDDFSQSIRNATFLRAEPIALNVSLENGPLFNLGLESGIGYIVFDVFMTSSLDGDNKIEVNCDCVIVNFTKSGHINYLIASSPSPSSNNAKENFSSIDCSVFIYSVES